MTVGFTARYVTPAWVGTKRLASAYGNFVFGTHNEKFADEFTRLRKLHGYTQLGTDIKAAYAKAAAKQTGGVFKNMWESFRNIPADFKRIKRNLLPTFQSYYSY